MCCDACRCEEQQEDTTKHHGARGGALDTQHRCMQHIYSILSAIQQSKAAAYQLNYSRERQTAAPYSIQHTCAVAVSHPFTSTQRSSAQPHPPQIRSVDTCGCDVYVGVASHPRAHVCVACPSKCSRLAHLVLCCAVLCAGCAACLPVQPAVSSLSHVCAEIGCLSGLVFSCRSLCVCVSLMPRPLRSLPFLTCLLTLVTADNTVLRATQVHTDTYTCHHIMSRTCRRVCSRAMM